MLHQIKVIAKREIYVVFSKFTHHIFIALVFLIGISVAIFGDQLVHIWQYVSPTTQTTKESEFVQQFDNMDFLITHSYGPAIWSIFLFIFTYVIAGFITPIFMFAYYKENEEGSLQRLLSHMHHRTFLLGKILGIALVAILEGIIIFLALAIAIYGNLDLLYEWLHIETDTNKISLTSIDKIALNTSPLLLAATIICIITTLSLITMTAMMLSVNLHKRFLRLLLPFITMGGTTQMFIPINAIEANAYSSFIIHTLSPMINIQMAYQNRISLDTGVMHMILFIIICTCVIYAMYILFRKNLYQLAAQRK